MKRIAILALLAVALTGCAKSPAELGPAMAAIRQMTPDVLEVKLVDGLVMIRLAGDWSDYGATRFACEDVAPIFTKSGADRQLFAVYDRFGKVIATGGRCG